MDHIFFHSCFLLSVQSCCCIVFSLDILVNRFSSISISCSSNFDLFTFVHQIFNLIFFKPKGIKFLQMSRWWSNENGWNHVDSLLFLFFTPPIRTSIKDHKFLWIVKRFMKENVWNDLKYLYVPIDILNILQDHYAGAVWEVNSEKCFKLK